MLPNSLLFVQVAILWRRDSRKVQYDWLEEGWNLEGQDLMRSRRKLGQMIDWVLKGKDVLPYTADIPELFDEHAQV